ncbi:ubiquinone biosynthesis hydrox [Rickenella mellea]|uniref:Ubiquinone biosynthesis monooxygenase COQ6, mitochondrial n=1 Tax=Rickenella mellea TaxID=50990 RepID=A0A4Y7Q8C0_9AGAM|nr:ubiquinone biosynthesis hydrox [Rickenella mellea]
MPCRLTPLIRRAVLSKGRHRQSRRLFATHSNNDEWDIVIVGGGPNGLALASALVASQPIRESLRIALVEAADLDKVRQWTPDSDTYSNRVSSITNASKDFMQKIGCWTHVDRHRTNPIAEMQVWDGVSDSRITFSASDMKHQVNAEIDGVKAIAHMTENLNIQCGLLRNLAERGAVSIIDKVKVSQIVREQKEGGGWPLVHTSDGRVLRTRLLVGADGFNSPVRAYAGIESFGWSYDTRAIVATLFHPPRGLGLHVPNTTAYQRFLPTGPIAFLPLTSTASSLVWSTKPDLAEAISKSDPAVLATMVNAAFRLPEISMRHLHHFLLGETATIDALLEEVRWRERSHDIDPHSAYSTFTSTSQDGIPPGDYDSIPPIVTSIQPGSIASFPIRFNHAESYIGESDEGARTALIGDAAHTIHPLAGQGLNMGLADADALAACVHNAVVLGNDIGSRTALIPYARARYFENHKLLAATDKLHKLYSTTLGPVVWARSVGLEVVNELDSVKEALMMSAGGNSSSSYDPSPANRSNAGDSLWPMAARGVEVLSGTFDTAKLVGKGLGGLAASNVTKLLSSYAKR